MSSTMARWNATGPGGKDRILVAPAEELATPSKVVLPEPPPAPGLLLPDGSINWGCPCLGGMATGPCGPHFRDAFSCFHNSTAEPKGSECFDKFNTMQQCMSRFPQLYGRDEDDDEGATMPGLGNDGTATAPDMKGDAPSSRGEDTEHKAK